MDLKTNLADESRNLPGRLSRDSHGLWIWRLSWLMDLETHLADNLETHLADGSGDDLYEVLLFDHSQEVIHVLR